MNPTLPFLILASAAFAQDRAVDARRETAGTALPQMRAPASSVSLRPAKSASTATGAGSDFGEQEIVQRRAHVEPWTVTGDAQFFHTDNVALSPFGEQRDSYLRTGLAVAYTNRIKGPLFVDFSLQQYLFRYAKFDALDFDLTRFEGGLLFEAPWLADSFFFARYTLQRITEPSFGTPSFTNHSINLGVQKVWKISRGQQVFAGLGADLALDTEPESATRDEYSLTLGYSLRLTGKLTTSASYRGSLLDYRHGSREDANHILSLGITYDLTDWLRLGTTASYSHNGSSADFAEYENLVLGASAAIHLAF